MSFSVRVYADSVVSHERAAFRMFIGFRSASCGAPFIRDVDIIADNIPIHELLSQNIVFCRQC